ncbi:hypothetical protein QTP70_003652 [Hemibagrus guttatus]|uniref:SPIN-DOC-like zinc-finger domain-containing protein n=1 Tax=Hemibagrus guttatus TaxID=175788 RepID=A0AAE0R5P8_9TELE|nr:hypothetical protein QTP70_003652 [Hemibagrus guttatus]
MTFLQIVLSFHAETPHLTFLVLPLASVKLQKKREYWRVMKRQQRARKAKEMERGKDALHPPQRKCGSSQVIHLPVAQKMNHTNHNHPVILPSVTSCSTWPALSPTASSNQQSSNEARHLLFEGQKDEAEVCYLPDDDCSDEPLSENKWRSIYLMDYDPVNQLLVCMVCGEQQYNFNVEEVKAHIEETHPDSLSLKEAERQRILQAWDEQVAVRERFFTNQLWQNSSVLKEQSSRHTAEVEVILGQDDKDQSKEVGQKRR